MAPQDLCEVRGLPFVCVQPLVSHVAREQEDLTGDKPMNATRCSSRGWRGSCTAMSQSICRGVEGRIIIVNGYCPWEGSNRSRSRITD